MTMSMLSCSSFVSNLLMSFTILAFFSEIFLGDLFSCFRPRGVLSGLSTLLVDRVERELVGLEVKILLLLPFRLLRLDEDQFILSKKRII